MTSIEKRLADLEGRLAPKPILKPIRIVSRHADGRMVDESGQPVTEADLDGAFVVEIVEPPMDLAS